jgi:hypothetical protein
MDLSVYITELLNEHGTINIPQIGVFKQVRMRGYYNAEEGKLYPPCYQTQFENKAVDDDTLLQYLISKSKVSATSAQFFLDKYLHNLLQQAEIGEAMLGRIGWISKDGDTINFRPALAIASNATAFGFTPVSVETEPAPIPAAAPVAALIEATEPVSTEPATTEPITPPLTYSVERGIEPQPTEQPANEQVVTSAASPLTTPVETAQQPVASAPALIEQPVTPPVNNRETESLDAVETDYDEPKFYSKPWFFGLVAGLIIIGAIVYYYPSASDMLYGRAKPTQAAPVPSMDSVVLKPTSPVTALKDTTIKTDTVQQVATKPDTAHMASSQQLPASTEVAPKVETANNLGQADLVNTNNYKFVLMSGAFSNNAAAVNVVNRYKTIGVPAAILKNVSPSKYVKVTLGFFETYAEGQAAKNKLVKLKHLRSSDLYVETLRKKRK